MGASTSVATCISYCLSIGASASSATYATFNAALVAQLAETRWLSLSKPRIETTTNMISIPIINQSKHPLPSYETISSAGMDLRANINENILLQPMQRSLIPTGLFIALPEGTEAQIRPRSGLAFKNGVTVLNSPGTIDADYRGEVKVLLINLSDVPFEIKDGDRIAQMVIAKFEHVSWKVTGELPETNRGAGGFGSTGK